MARQGFVVRRVGQWRQAALALTAGSSHTIVQGALDKAMYSEAQRARSLLVKGILSGAPGGKRFKPLSKTTLAVRKSKGGRGARSSKPLIKSGSLLRAITVKKQRGEGAFAGILRTARTSSGNLANLMQIHEQGKTIAVKVTPAMHRFLMATFRDAGLAGGGSGGLARGVLIIRIPARPVFAPVWDKHFRGSASAKRVGLAIQPVLSGLGGGRI